MNNKPDTTSEARTNQSLREAYQEQLENGSFEPDQAQQQAVDALQAVHDQLVSRKPRSSFLRRRQPWPQVQGLYLWGGVGRGKTWLMDRFYEALPFSRKQRTHFHRFMLQVQNTLTHYRDETDPLVKVARELATQTRVLCFDEFQVYNIADAMVLGRLFDNLFDCGITLVATSNVPPDELYRDGLQRQRFLPAIAALKRHCRVLNVDSGMDYRLRALHVAPIYLCPDDAKAEQQLGKLFRNISRGDVATDTTLKLNDRKIPVKRMADNVAWFSFDALCQGPRGTADYVVLARKYPTILLSHVPHFDAFHESAAHRFINLVDEFYDRGVKLVISADRRPKALYAGKRLAFEFQRTCSRLIEMQSREYLAAPHSV